MRFIDKYYPILNALIGLGGFALIIIDAIFPNFIEISLDPPYQILSALLCLVLTSLGYERYKQKESIENTLVGFSKSIEKIDTDIKGLSTSVNGISNFEIIEGRNRITEETMKEVRKVRHNIRATTFKFADHEETSYKYYEELGKTLQQSHNLTYECCYNAGVSFAHRSEEFKKLNFAPSDYKKMKYYEFKDHSYMNFLIFDSDVVFIGFPTNQDHEHMHFVIKLSSSNQKEKVIIENLVAWYDEVLKTSGVKQETVNLLNSNPK